MSVHQVEEFFILMEELSLNIGEVTEINTLVSDEGYSDTEWLDDDSVLIINDIGSEEDAENLQDKLNEIINV